MVVVVATPGRGSGNMGLKVNLIVVAVVAAMALARQTRVVTVVLVRLATLGLAGRLDSLLRTIAGR